MGYLLEYVEVSKSVSRTSGGRQEIDINSPSADVASIRRPNSDVGRNSASTLLCNPTWETLCVECSTNPWRHFGKVG
jgi:hypothetical protein